MAELPSLSKETCESSSPVVGSGFNVVTEAPTEELPPPVPDVAPSFDPVPENEHIVPEEKFVYDNVLLRPVRGSVSSKYSPLPWEGYFDKEKNDAIPNSDDEDEDQLGTVEQSRSQLTEAHVQQIWENSFAPGETELKWGKDFIDRLPVVTLEVDSHDDYCCICLEVPNAGAKVKRLPCMHAFHQTCIDEWLEYSASCPLCMGKL